MTLRTRFQLASVAGLVAILALSGCSSSDSTDASDALDKIPTFAPEAEGEIDTGDATGGKGNPADQYCQVISEYVEEYQDFLANSSNEDRADQFAKRSEELSQRALEIASKPDLTKAEREQIEKCTEDLVNVTTGGQ